MKLELPIVVTQTGDGFKLTVGGINSVSDAADKAKHKLDEIGHGKDPFAFLTHGSDELFESMLKTVSIVGLAEKAFELLGEAVEFVKEGIGHADFVRDLNLSLQAYTGSAAAATKVIDYFNESQIKTRNTAEELQQTFRNLNPLATAKGFTNEAQQQVTVMLSQIATVSNKSISEIEAGYRRILATGGSGGGVGRNPLLQVLGITAEQLRAMGWDEFIAKMQEVSGRADEFGQSWESTMHKAKIELLNDFAEGWNGARGSAVDGMDAITAAVRDPVVKETLVELGKLTAEWTGKLGGAITEIKGIGAEIKSIVTSPYFRLWLMTATLGGSEMVRLGASSLGLLGDAGNDKLKTAEAAARERSGASLLLSAGVVAPQPAVGSFGYSDYAGAYKGLQPVPALEGYGNALRPEALQNLEKAVGDLIAEDKMSTAQIAAFAAQLRANAEDAKKAGRPLNADDINAARADAMKSGLEGVPTGKLGKAEADHTAELENQTKQLLAQAAILDLQNEKLSLQAEMGKEEQQLGEKKTGLENVQLDALTQQVLLRHHLNALRVVGIDEQIAETKAASDYWTTITDINKKQKEEAAKPGGGVVSAATFDAARDAAGVRYNKTLDEINAKTAKGQSDATVAQRKLTLEAQATIQARNEELIKIRALVGAQGEEDAILARQLTNAQTQTQLFGLELALQNQRVNFGATNLSQQADALLKLHEQVTLQQTANDTEIAMQEERTRYTKEQTELAKQMAAVTISGFAGPAEMIQAIASGSDRLKLMQSGGGVNPAIDQLTLLAAKQREGSELRLQAVIENGHLKVIADIKSEAELRNAKIEEAMKGYADLANLIGSTTHDLFADLLAGGDMKHMLQNLVSGYQSLLGGALDGVVNKYLKAWQQMAQGTVDPATGQPGHIDPTTGKMVATTPAQQQNAQNAMAVAQGAVALFSTYQAAQSSRGAGIVTGAVGGATIGMAAGPYGAIAGAVIGGLYGAVFSAIAEGSKARFELTVGSDGRVSVSGFGKATSGNVDAAMHTINDTIHQASAAIRGIIDAFPIAIASQLEGLGNLPQGTLGTNVEKTRTFAISIFKKSFKGGYTANQLQHFMTDELPKILLDSAMPMITEGLSDLGVNLAKITSLEATASEDPAKAFQFITDYVTGFVAMRDSIAFLGKSSADKTAIALGPSVNDQLAKANDQIAYLGKGFADLSNVDQVDRLKQINAAIAQRYQIELKLLAEVSNAMKAVAKSYMDTLHGFGMSAASPEDQLILLQSQRAAVAASLDDKFNARTRQMVAGAKTPAEVAAIANDYAALTTQIYNAAKTLRDTFQNILDSFKAIEDQKIADARAALDPTAHLNAITAKASGIAASFGGMNDADKIANSQTLIQLANEYYQIQKQALIALGDAAKSIHESITKQILDIQLDQQKDHPQQQIEMLLAQRRTLYASLSAATTADQINAIIQQIQGNVTTVAGLEGNTPEAAARSIQALQEADKAAQLQLAALVAQAKANDDAIQAAITGVTTAVQTTITTLDALMTQATNDLIAFGALIQAKLKTFVDDMQASDAALLLTLQPIFDALGNSVSTTGDDLDAANIALPDFTTAVITATDRLNRFADWSGFTGGGNNSFTGSSMTVTMPTPSFSINISGDMAPFVTMVRLVANEEMNKREAQMMRFSRSGGPL